MKEFPISSPGKFKIKIENEMQRLGTNLQNFFRLFALTYNSYFMSVIWEVVIMVLVVILSLT